MAKEKKRPKAKQSVSKKQSKPKEQPRPKFKAKPAAKAKPAKKAPAEPMERSEEELVDLTSRVYKLVVERGKDGVLQSEIWKELGLTSRDGSRLAIRLERRGLIGRVKVLEEGRWTYKLTPLRFPTDMASIEKAPCIVCQFEPKCSVDGEISPYICPWIGPWAIEEMKRSQNPAAQAAAVPVS